MKRIKDFIDEYLVTVLIIIGVIAINIIGFTYLDWGDGGENCTGRFETICE